ncbi:hypothetical protein OESDEN_10246 [Oesophagostomum dentatum]|uniref:RRM domain-containing protein n=1 Tax=Oesophagostomum dentatum TaxID=61180 RepID=A0A0B1SX80_OESDE|nr:hypothetical protein OESDEN_10246 [Oesophagostomum dentatum]
MTAARGGTNCYAWRGGSKGVTNPGRPFAVTTYYRSNVYPRPGFYTRNSVPNPIQLASGNNRGSQGDSGPSAPKFFPMAQGLTPGPQFGDGMPMPLQYPLPMRRMMHPSQPIPPHRDIRFTTPTPIVISKKVPIGVDVSCSSSTAPRNSSADTPKEPQRPKEEPPKENQPAEVEPNRGDSDADEEDGRTSPDVLSASLRSNEDTWDFWDRVYSDPELRQSMQERQRDSPMAELLHSDKLCKAQLVFLNVPRLAYGKWQQHVVRSLIHREINTNLPILDIHITYRKWTVRFYRSEDAIQVLRHFNGFSFRNHKLLVRSCQNNSGFGDVTSLEEAAQLENEERRAVPDCSSENRMEYDPIWTLVEWKDIVEFKK